MHKVFEMILDLNFIERNMEVTYLACINLQQLMVGNIKLVVKLTSQNTSKYFNIVLFFCRNLHMCLNKKLLFMRQQKVLPEVKWWILRDNFT